MQKINKIREKHKAKLYHIGNYLKVPLETFRTTSIACKGFVHLVIDSSK